MPSRTDVFRAYLSVFVFLILPELILGQLVSAKIAKTEPLLCLFNVAGIDKEAITNIFLAAS